MHLPVMVNDALENLALREGQTIVDCTIGEAGHGREILKRITPGGKLIGIDRDKEVLAIARDKLKDFTGSFELLNGNFRELSLILKKLELDRIDGLLFDLGVSSFQLESGERGFSLKEEGPLDMRMDPAEGISAYGLVNNSSFEELADIFQKFGEEHRAYAVARAIVTAREASPIKTTAELAHIAIKVLKRHGRWQRIHPATRIFQALRIAVNDELSALEEGLSAGIDCLKTGGRVAVISFHSLEDRIVKQRFRKYSDDGIIRTITPKPLTPSFSEVKENPRCRSAKLRAAEKI